MRGTYYPLLAFGIVLALLTSCTPAQPQIVRETVIVERQATTVVKETVAVAKTRTKVAFWHIYGSGPKRDLIDRFVADFNATNPDYVVEPFYTDFWVAEQKALAAIAAGDPPDVFMVGQIGKQAEAKQIVPLDEYIERDKFDISAFWDYCQDDIVYKGHVWGIPWGPDTRLFYYNKAHFAEVGLDPERPPKTWDELFEYALRLDKKDASGNFVRVGFSPTWGNCWPFTFLHTNGAVLIDESGRPQFTTPEVLETLRWYKKWVDHYGKENLETFAAGFGTGAQDPFISGQVSMIVQTNSYVGTLQQYAPEMKWGIALVPYNRTPSSWGGGGVHLRIPVGAKNPDGAWEFIKYFTSREATLEYAKVTGVLPPYKDVGTAPELVEAVPGWEVILEALKVTRVLPFVLEAPSWIGPLATAFEEVWSGIKTPEQAAADAQAAVEKEIENFRATQ